MNLTERKLKGHTKIYRQNKNDLAQPRTISIRISKRKLLQHSQPLSLEKNPQLGLIENEIN